MSDEREFNLESPRAQKVSQRVKPKMGKVAPKKNGPQLASQRKGKRSRATYVERPEKEVDPKGMLVAGFGSKLQLILFIGVVVVIGGFLAPHVIEFLNLPN